MSLIKCPECGREMSDKAKNCPNCGFQIGGMKAVRCPRCGENFLNTGKCPKCGYFFFETSNSLVLENKTERDEDGKDNVFKRASKFIYNGFKIIAALLISLIVFSFLYASFGGDSGDGNDSDYKDERNETTKTPSKKPSPTKKESMFENELDEYKKNEYPYITLDDIEKYHENMDDVKILLVTDVDGIDDEKIQSTICEGFMMSGFYTVKSYKNILKDDDIVAIIGTVNGYNDWGAAGKSINFKDCMVIASGKDAEKYKKEKSDESLEEYFVITEEVVSSGAEATEEEYKELCKEMEYNDILRNPDSYKEKMCKVSGNVDQIVEGWLSTLTIYIEDSDGNKWGCTYTYEEGESHVLEGDKLTVYGECKGTDKVKTVLGKQVILPVVEVKYIEIQ